jgi:hypothetical protein
MQNNKEAASSYVAHGFKLCAVRGKKPFQDKWEQNPVTDLNLFDHNGIGLIHGLSGTCTLDIDNIEHTQIALEAVGLNLAELMRDGVRIESGRLNRSKLIYKAPKGIELKRHALNWVNEVNPKESDVVFELRGGMTQDVLPPSIHPDTNKPYVWCGDWTQLPELPIELLNIWTQWDIAKDVLKSACPWHVEKEDYKAQSAPLRVFKGGDNDVIGAFNQRMGLIGLLENYGYRRITKTRMLSPHSKSKLAGCVLLTGDDVDKVYIHHASDPLGDGYAHSAFSVFLYYQHNNDLKNAVKEAALLLDMDYKKPLEDETLLEQGNAIAKAFLSPNVVELKPVQVDTVKIDCSLPVDCLNEVAVWIKGQIGTAPKYSIVQATLAFACAMSSRCVRLKDGTSSSAFLAIVADSAGQLQPLKGILNSAIDACGDRNIIRGTKISGSSCLHKQLLTMPRMFWATDDYAQMISFGKKQQSGAIQGALSAINEVYLNNTLYLDKDSVGANFGKKDGDGDKHISEYNIYRPSLTMLSLMSYKHIDFVAQRDQYSIGSLQRLMIADGGDSVTCERDFDAPFPTNVKVVVAAIKKTGSEFVDIASMNPVQKIADFDNDNTATLFSHSLTRIKATCNSDERKDLLGVALGWCGSFKRLCVALGAFNNPSSPVINESIVQWCSNWIVFHLEKLLSRLEINGLDEEIGIEEDVLNVVYDFGKKGASSRDIGQKLRAFRNMDAVQKLEMLTKLQAQEKIFEKKEGKAVRFFMPVFFKSDCVKDSK